MPFAHRCRAVKDVVLALHPDPDMHHIGMGYNLESSELLSERQLQDLWTAFIGNPAGREP